MTNRIVPRPGRLVAWCVAGIGLMGLVWPASGWSADYAFIIGGGPSASRSEISIERNTRRAQKGLVKLGVSPDKLTTFFASGPKAGLDVCYIPEPGTPDANKKLAALLGSTKGLSRHYRPHELQAIESSSTRDEILAKLRDYAQKLTEKDRLIIYVTGHGSKGKPIENGSLALWDGGRLNVKEFTAALDEMSPKVPVMLVVVTCYGGSFANVIFKGGDADQGVAEHPRVGFFASLASRPAAGCSPLTGQQIVPEFSLFFWSALMDPPHDKTLPGVVDINRNGTIGTGEAHTHALLHADTIDISIRTSDRFLRRFSKLEGRDSKFLEYNRDFSRLNALADPQQQFIMKQLSSLLKLSGEDRIGKAEKVAEALDDQRQEYRKQAKRKEGDAKRLKYQLAKHAKTRWPFLANPWHPQTHELLRANQDQVLAYLKKHEKYKAWEKLNHEADELSSKARQAEEKWAKYQRLIETAKSVALSHHLQFQDNGKQLKEQYDDLRARENAFLEHKPQSSS